MFLTFESSQNSEVGPRNPKRTRRSERISRRGSTPRACASCRRRKIKCNGEKPCEACRWYKKPELCSYPELRPSQSHSEKSARAASPDYRGVLERLFPDTSPENIVHLPREKLLDLMHPAGSQDVQHQDSPAIASSVETHVSSLSMERPGLESLHSMPGEQLDENRSNSASDSLEHISDDVNALSLTARHPTSYLGLSSIQAALRVIALLHPEFESYFSLSSFKGNIDQPVNPLPRSRAPPQTCPPPTEVQMLDAYFVNFQPFAPLLDEHTFRSTYLAGRRKDDRWLALLNIVLALGSIAAAGANDHTHRVYFERLMSRLNLRSLGNPSLELVQALGLLGGWYCHYISQPNLGYSLMGVSLRMAITLGLQREPYDSHLAVDPKKSAAQELRRRIWWSLACLETWALETLGRPSMDCFGPSITVNLPSLLDKENYSEVLPLIENIQFVKISKQIQESLAALPTLTHSEMFDMDSQLLQWWNNLPPVLKDYEPCPESLYTVRTVMRWRFYNQRMLVYRPRLLSYAMRRVPFMAIRSEERTAIQKCREIAELSIQDISMTTQLNQMIGWNAVWLLFQATMVPLICLSIGSADDDSRASFEACKTQVETAIQTLDRMQPYGHTAGRSLEVVSRILEVNLHAPDVEPPDTSAEGLASQDFPVPNVLSSYQSVPRDRVLDRTAGSFENCWSQYMWEYLSWDANNLWPGLSDFNAQNDALPFLDPTGEGK